jgi:transcriptional regulator with XRE-family HTH domain
MSELIPYDQVRKSWNLDEKRIRKGVRRLLALADGVKLAELRQAKRLTQAQMAKKLKIDQSNVSRIERGSFDAIEIRTLRRYVEALGGEIEIRVRIDEKSQRLIDSEYERKLERRLAQRTTGRKSVAKKRVKKEVRKKGPRKPAGRRQA